jgi:hypothetical protein
MVMDEWTAILRGGGAPQWAVYSYALPRGGQRRRVATIGSPHSYSNPELEAENAAYAKLVASVPYLLQALEEIASTLDLESFPDSGSIEGRLGDIARAALAAAGRGNPA